LLGSLMLIKLQRNLKMVSVNAAKAEKINEMVYGETKGIRMMPLSTWKKGRGYIWQKLCISG